MRSTVAIVADFSPNSESHRATDAAFRHAVEKIGIDLRAEWVGTHCVTKTNVEDKLRNYAGIWIGPGSPYASMDGALEAIRFARERGIPLLGTCGGFQHSVIEYGRNVLGIARASHEESSSGEADLLIVRLEKSLAGRTMNLILSPGSKLSEIYRREQIREGFLCSFGVNVKYKALLESRDLRFVADDEEGGARALEISSHRYFIGTLYLPQLSSSEGYPHPIITSFISACAAYRHLTSR